MTNFIEKKIEEFNKRFANPTAKYLGNDFDNYPKANIKDANDFLRQALTQQLDELKGKVDGCQEIYTSGSRKGEVKEHTDSCCNETISDILTIIDSMK